VSKKSAGIILFRKISELLKKKKRRVFVYSSSGRPFWAKKDEGAWSIPKEFGDDGPLAAAKRSSRRRPVSLRKVR
jgi:predicted NUDIX family NTP pyrophosphohydrolase